MRPFASLIVGVLFVFASKVSTQTIGETLHVVDYRTLKTCYAQSDCLPWQVCATCVHSHISVLARYCSDLTFRGICGYQDQDFFCSCDENSSDKPQAQRESLQNLMNQATTQGDCITDSDCDDPSREKNFRCTTCMQPGSAVSNVCGSPEITAKLCSPSGPFSTLCSCGQLYPEPQRIWPLEERDRFINQQKKLGGIKVGDLGNHLAQPVAATPEIDFINDQAVDSVQAGILPGDGDWTV